MQSATYQQRRSQLETYFDRTAADAWAKLTSDAPVSGVRARVRAGRDAIRATLLGWLPDDLSGVRILDAGCGAGQLTIAAAQRGADIVAIDLAETLVALARDRAAGEAMSGSIDWRVGDMFDAAHGRFDYVVAMDSLIHYDAADIVRVLGGFAGRTSRGVLFTFAPKTPALTLMHAAGRLFPRADRAPAIAPVADSALRRLLADEAALKGWRPARAERISTGFYTSEAMELTRA